MKRNQIIKPWGNKFKALLFLFICFFTEHSLAQNATEKVLKANHIETISVDGNQVFSISVSTSHTDYITIKSTLDGEYQNQYQVRSAIQNKRLKLNLEFISFTPISDDKRNAHKVIAATLQLEIPETMNLNIISDIGSVDLSGNYNTLSIKLLQGNFSINGEAKTANINTIDGNINVVSKYAQVEAVSKNGDLNIGSKETSSPSWKLQSIHGNITVVKPE